MPRAEVLFLDCNARESALWDKPRGLRTFGLTPEFASASKSLAGCDLSGSFIPFATTKAQRIASGDPRLSLEERYGSHANIGLQ
jgi:hypothetical protein